MFFLFFFPFKAENNDFPCKNVGEMSVEKFFSFSPELAWPLDVGPNDLALESRASRNAKTETELEINRLQIRRTKKECSDLSLGHVLIYDRAWLETSP